MNRRLERNICKLSDGITNSEVSDLEERIEQRIDRALQYACKSWHKHLVDIMSAHIIPILHHFLEKNFLFWLEVLSCPVAREKRFTRWGWLQNHWMYVAFHRLFFSKHSI